MPMFEYRALDAEGKPQKGKLEASGEDEALRILGSQNLYPQSISSQSSGKEIRLPTSGRAGLAQVALLARQLESIIGAGVSVEQAISFVARNSRSEVLREALGKMLEDIRAGSSVSDAARKHPKIFDGFFCGMLSAGEATGELEKVLGRVASYYERQAEIRRKVGGAAVYPIVVTLAGVGLMWAMMTFVVPQFVQVVQDLGTQLPAATKMVIGLSHVVKSYGLMFLLLVGAGVVGLQVYTRTESGKLSMAHFVLGLPMFGLLARQTASASFAASLAFAMDSGLEILSALGVAKESVQNAAAKDAIDHVRASVERGTAVHEALRAHASGVFDPMLADMAAAGQEAGEMSRLLTRAASFYEGEINSTTEGLLKALEPLLIVVIGVLAGGVVFSLFMPIVQLTKSVQNGF